jgi:hypothetical protein
VNALEKSVKRVSRGLDINFYAHFVAPAMFASPPPEKIITNIHDETYSALNVYNNTHTHTHTHRFEHLSTRKDFSTLKNI